MVTTRGQLLWRKRIISGELDGQGRTWQAIPRDQDGDRDPPSQLSVTYSILPLNLISPNILDVTFKLFLNRISFVTYY